MNEAAVAAVATHKSLGVPDLAVLIAVSLLTPAPERHKLAGLTFATVDERLVSHAVPRSASSPRAETPVERRVNIGFSLLLLATVIGLWIHFR